MFVSKTSKVNLDIKALAGCSPVYSSGNKVSAGTISERKDARQGSILELITIHISIHEDVPKWILAS
jgi:hypothetical protein